MSPKIAKIGTVVAAAGFLIVTVGKLMQGEMPSWMEVTLAVSTIGAAIGFQFTPKA